jgi:hypothetical protein
MTPQLAHAQQLFLETLRLNRRDLAALVLQPEGGLDGELAQRCRTIGQQLLEQALSSKPRFG